MNRIEMDDDVGATQSKWKRRVTTFCPATFDASTFLLYRRSDMKINQPHSRAQYGRSISLEGLSTCHSPLMHVVSGINVGVVMLNSHE